MPVPFATPTAWTDLPTDADALRSLETTVLPHYVNACRWFAGKAREQVGFRIQTVHTLPTASGPSYLLIVEAHYVDGDREHYQLPIALVPTGADVPEKAGLADAQFASQAGRLIDAIYDEPFRQALFGHVVASRPLPQPDGQVLFHRGRGYTDEPNGGETGNWVSRVLPVDSSNSALVYNDTYFLKLYRKLFAETNPEVDMVAFITEHSDFAHIPAYAGSVTWRQTAQPDVTLGMMQRLVPNEKDSWAMTGDYLNDFLYAVPNRLFAIREDVFEKVELLGRRTGEMHLALYQPDRPGDAPFRPEPFTNEYRQFIARRFSELLARRYDLLINNYARLDAPAQRLAWVFMEAKEMIDDFLADFQTRPLGSLRIRIHGDYHLGQVLATPTGDYVIIDFEGEPESSITERKIKHSPLKDVAGMIRSYHYAVSAKLFNSVETAGIDPEKLQVVSERWFKLIRDTYVDAYLTTFGSPHPLFYDNAEINYLLLIYLLEKAVYELGYEISYRPSWVKIPLKGIVDVIREIEKLQPGGSDRKTATAPLHMVS